jgi:hypothetical protein
MSAPRRRILTLTLGLLLTAAASTRAVVIFFKDGSKEIIADSYRIAGDRLIATLQSGQETAIPLAAVDLERTESTGRVAKGSAILLDRPRMPGEDAAPPRERTLMDVMRDRAVAAPSAPAAQNANPNRPPQLTPAGNLDFFAVPRHRVEPAARAEAITSLARRRGLTDAEVFQGTRPNRVMIDIVTASRGEVFGALETCAGILIELRSTTPDVEALELVMATATRSRAGQFVLTPEQAEELRSGAVTPEQHFVAHVLF